MKRNIFVTFSNDKREYDADMHKIWSSFTIIPKRSKMIATMCNERE